MLVHKPGGQVHLLDFFVQAPAVVAPAKDQVEFVVDFEGEPARSLGDRRVKGHSYL